jgi:hypothetical protein
VVLLVIYLCQELLFALVQKVVQQVKDLSFSYFLTFLQKSVKKCKKVFFSVPDAGISRSQSCPDFNWVE